MSFKNSEEYYARAKEIIPGGVNSPVRAFNSIKLDPIFIERGEGPYLYDVDKNKYIDYVCSWGPLILGHRHPEVIEALTESLQKGTGFGAPTDSETKLVQEIIDAVPSIEMARLVSSGTEATMSALRLARGYTGRNKIVKFEGCYHGHVDSLLIKAGSGALTNGVPTSPGVPSSIAEDTIVLTYNDIEKYRELFYNQGSEIAAVIVEPVAGNMGVIPPEPGFLENLRKITLQYGSILIFDEVMTGFRVAYGGAQELYGIEPDLTCLGKIIGGGLPVGAYGGKKKIMEYISPSGPVYQAGTLAGNPITVKSGLATLNVLKRKNIYEQLNKKASRLAKGIQDAAQESEYNISINRVGSMLCTYFTDQQVIDFSSANNSNIQAFLNYITLMLKQGIYMAPSQFEAAFISLQHDEEHIEKTVAAAKKAFKKLKK
ncbi:MAG: glutamate-1-semialdehyde 2,1-aminomutase [Clostridiales bacterium]|nr:glutamate-1-semialdehyde 2,1-aminomutase [Clostridiales bacterium]MCF8021934.1 glutamate-1-semialdehyde 2,1-aminomutase [Clostridiales bacterium]